MQSSDELLRQAKAMVEVVGRQPRRRLAVVTCMDTRIDPLAIYGATVGDLHVIRNAGGVVNGDVLRSLLVSQYRLATTAIDVVMHTDCGMLGLDSRGLAGEIAGETGQRLSVDFGGFEDLESELRRGVDALRGSDTLRHRDRVRGLVFDVETNMLDVVVRL